MTLLTESSNHAVINVATENPLLIKKVTRLKQSIQLREEARLAGNYLRTCRLAEDLTPSLTDLLNIENSNIFSLNDFCSIRLGIYIKRLKLQLNSALQHIFSCELCLAKAFFCEKCRATDLIFPFQSDVIQCQQCFACFHQKCYKTPCSKCIRVKIRDTFLVN